MKKKTDEIVFTPKERRQIAVIAAAVELVFKQRDAERESDGRRELRLMEERFRRDAEWRRKHPEQAFTPPIPDEDLAGLDDA